MPLVFDNTRTAKQGGGWIERPDVNAWVTTELPALQKAAAEKLAREQGRWGVADKVAMAAVMAELTGGLGAAVGGPASAAGGVGATGSGTMGTLNNVSTIAQIIGPLLSGAAKGQAADRGNQNAYGQDANRNALSLYGTQQNALLSALLAQGRDAQQNYGTQQGATTAATQGRQSATTHALDATSAEGLARARLGLEAPSARAHQSVLGSLMKNLQPTQMQGPAGQKGHETTITGGLNASMLDPTTRQHGDELMKSALMAQLSGSDVPKATDFMSGVQDWDKSVLAPPPATDYTKGLLTPPTMAGYKQPGKLETGLSWGGTIGDILGEILKLRNSGAKSYEPNDMNGFG